MNRKKRLFFVLVLLVFCQATSASFIGNTIDGYISVPPSPFFGPGGVFSRDQAIVGNSTEFTSFGVLNESSVDFSDASIDIRFVRPSTTFYSLAYFVFEDYDSSIADISGVSISPETTSFLSSAGTPLEFLSSRISFTSDSIILDFSGLGANANNRLVLDVSFASSATDVPLPGTLLLLFASLPIFLTMTHWKRRIRA